MTWFSFSVILTYMDENSNLTFKDVADILGVTRMTIYNRVNSGDLPDDPDEMVRSTIREMETEIDAIKARYADVKARAYLRTI